MVLIKKLRHELAGVKEGRLDYFINAFLGAYNRRTDVLAKQSGGSDSQKLDAIIEMLRAQSGVATDLALVKEQLNTIHGLIADLASADPETIRQLAASVKTVREKLQTSLDKQQKGD